MFYKFFDIDTTLVLININRISHIYGDDRDSALFHIVLVDDLVEDIEIIIDYDQLERFESWLRLCKLN